MTSFTRTKLLSHLASRRRQTTSAISQGFTLVELMIVIVIVGILSAVAIPQFMKQTKKAVATEGVTQASAITKQAATYQLETPITAADSDCSDYAGALPQSSDTPTPKFTYACSGDAAAFVVTATGTADTNAEGITVTQTSDLETGAVGKPEITYP